MTNFTGKKFLNFSDGYSIRIDWASVRHPRTNGQVEQANGMVLQGLKPRWVMGRRGPSDPLEPENDPKLIHRVHTLLLGLWG